MKTVDYWIYHFERINALVFDNVDSEDTDDFQSFVRTDSQAWKKTDMAQTLCEKVIQDKLMDAAARRKHTVTATLDNGKSYCISLSLKDIEAVILAHSDLLSDVEDKEYGLPVLSEIFVLQRDIDVTHCIHTQMNIKEKRLSPIFDYFYADNKSIPKEAKKIKVAQALKETNRFLKVLWPPLDIL